MVQSGLAPDEADLPDGRRCHIVIGGGSAGVMLCQQLLEYDDVIIIERGSKDPHSRLEAIRSPFLWPAAALCSGEITLNNTLPQSKSGEREIRYPQGSGIGGTSNINAMIWSAGHPAVFDNYWPEEWNSKAVSSYFAAVREIVKPITNKSPLLRQIAISSGCSSHMNISRRVAADTSVYAASSSGPDDYSDSSDAALIWDIQPVKASYLSTIDINTHERINMKDILYKDQYDEESGDDICRDKTVNEETAHSTEGNNSQESNTRGMLTVLEHSTVISILFENATEKRKKSNQTEESKLIAVAVQYMSNNTNEREGKLIKPLNGGEIILCAGVFESPRILISSGLGGTFGPSGNTTDDDTVRIDQNNKADKGQLNDTNHNNNVGAVSGVLNSLPSLPVTLNGIGCNLQDHPMLPIMVVGKWWSSSSRTGGDGCQRVLSNIKALNGDFISTNSNKPEGADGTNLEFNDSKSNISSVGGISFKGLFMILCSATIGVICGIVRTYNIDVIGSCAAVITYIKNMPDLGKYALYLGLTQLLILSIVMICNIDNNEGKISYPLNSAHGYVSLDENGDLLPSDSKVPPSAQLLLMDGALAPAYLLPELLFPRFSSRSSHISFIYMTFLRPPLAFALKVVLLLPPVEAIAGCTYGFLVCNVQPHSRDLGLLTDDRDMVILYNAMKTARKLLNGHLVSMSPSHATPVSTTSSPASTSKSTSTSSSSSTSTSTSLSIDNTPSPLSTTSATPPYTSSKEQSGQPVIIQNVPINNFEILPGPLFGNTENESNFRSYARSFATTYYHASGTCAMQTPKKRSGNNDNKDDKKGGKKDDNIDNKIDVDEAEDLSVVDGELRVRGVKNLRVADASVFPKIPSGPTSATCMAVGVAAGRLILGRRDLGP